MTESPIEGVCETAHFLQYHHTDWNRLTIKTNLVNQQTSVQAELWPTAPLFTIRNERGAIEWAWLCETSLDIDISSSLETKEIVERRHGEPIKFLFLPKMGLLVSQAGNEKNCWLWIMSNFWGLFFHVCMGKNLFFFFTL